MTLPWNSCSWSSLWNFWRCGAWTRTAWFGRMRVRLVLPRVFYPRHTAVEMVVEDLKKINRGALTNDMVMLENFPGKPAAFQWKASRSKSQRFSLVALLPNLNPNSTGHIGHESNIWIEKHGLNFKVAASFITESWSELALVFREKSRTVLNSGAHFG